MRVKLRHCHNRERHIEEEERMRQAGEAIVRSSVLSTNEFLIVIATNGFPPPDKTSE